MTALTEIVSSVFRLTIPFEDIYTTVFLIRTPQGDVLFDTATYPHDVDDYILPAMSELHISQETLRYIVLSHGHRDHAGGLTQLTRLFPEACIVSLKDELRRTHSASPFLFPGNDCLLLDSLRIIAVPGHAPDCLSLFDLRTRTLLTGDCLQLYGIFGCGKWGANITRPDEHFAALDRLRMLNPAVLIASHDYHPCGYIARGKDEIDHTLNQCREALLQIRDFIRRYPDDDCEALALRYMQAYALPTVGSHVFSAVRSSSLMEFA